MPIDLCTVSGVLHQPDGSFAPAGTPLTIMRTVKSGLVITLQPIPVYVTGASGAISFAVPRASTAYIFAEAYAGATDLDKPGGVALAIPDAATATLESLGTLASVPSQGITVYDESTLLAGLYHTFKFIGGVVAAQASAGVLTVTIPSGAAWDDITGKPSTFAPSAHAASHASAGSDPLTLAQSQITNLVSDLAAKQAAFGVQAANLIYAGPVTGAAATPTFRALAVADLPTGILNAQLANPSVTINGTANRLTGGGVVALGGSLTLNVDTSLLPSPVGGDAGKFLKASGANAAGWNALVAGDIPDLSATYQPLLGFTPVPDTRTVNGHALSANVTVAFSELGSIPTTLAGYGITDAQPLDADLTAIAGLSPSNDDLLQRKSGAWINRTPAQVKTDLALVKADVGLGNVANSLQLVAANNLSDLTNAGTARTNLGLVIGTDVQGFDADLSAIAALAGTAGLLRKTAANTWSLDTNTYATQAYADALIVGLLDDRGNYDASGNVFPSSGGSGTAGAVLKGDLWTISVAGTLGGSAVTAGDVVRALVDTPGQTASNWAISENNFGYVALNQALASGKFYVGNGSGIGTAVTPTGDVTFDNVGVFAIGAGKVTNAMLAGSIAYSKLTLTGAILNADLAGSIAASKLIGSDIATVGTITSGTWQGTAVADSFIASAAAWNAKQPGDATLTALAAYNTNGLVTQTAADTFTGRTLTGTSNRISISNGNGVSGNPTIDIDSGYVGQASITTLGTIGTGVWNATAIAYAKLTLTGSIVNADVSASAGIVDTKLATISTAGKVSDSALSSNVPLKNVANVFTTVNTFQRNGIGATLTDAIAIQNATAATGGAQTQQSPSLGFYSSVWDTDRSESHAFDARLTLTPGYTDHAFARWRLDFSDNGGSWVEVFSVDETGHATFTHDVLINGASASSILNPGTLVLDSSITLTQLTINAEGIFGSTAGVDIGSAGSALRDIYFYGSGVYSSTSFKLTGTPTGARVVTFPDSNTNLPIASQTLTFTGPTAARSFALPDANATILTTNAAVTVAQGGTGITSFGTGIATFLGTPSSANLAAAVTDETGSGALVFGTSPIIVTPTIASFANANHNHQNSAGGGTLAEAALVLTDVTTGNVSTSAHGFAPKAPNDATYFLNGVGGYTKARPYLLYVAIMTQNGTNAPTVTVLENTLGGAITWSYVGTGEYLGTRTGAFTASKTVIFITPDAGSFDNWAGGATVQGNRVSNNTVRVASFDARNLAQSDDVMSIGTTIEIRVYP